MRAKRYTQMIISITFILCLLSLMLSGCNSKPNDLKDDFIEYHSAKFEGSTLVTSSNTKMSVMSLNKESKNHVPRVVLWLHMDASDDEKYQWLQLSYDERKEELKKCGELVIAYAKNQGWDNDYYLYVSIVGIFDGCDMVYDYETNSLYVPNCENTFVQMYQRFDTFEKEDLIGTDEGKEFLLKKGLATTKHGEIDFNSNIGYTVFICDGEFGSFGDDDSSKH